MTDQGWSQVSVADTGPGVAPEVLERLFQPFMTTKPQGMGVGLSISRSIIEAHGGCIRAENREDGGARFTMTLPLGQPPLDDGSGALVQPVEDTQS